MKKILITGGCGFAGSSLAISLKINYPRYEIIAMDNLKRKGSELNIKRLAAHNVHFIHGDIRNKEDFENMPSVNTVIDSSAEPSVLAGVNSAPDYLLNTNLIGTINCLNFAVKHHADLIFLSTSRVYPIHSLEKINFEEEDSRFKISSAQTIHGFSTKGVSEEFPMKGARSLYGTTKFAAELIIEEYNYFYKLKSVINRCGVLA